MAKVITLSDKCIGCGACVAACPNEAVKFKEGFTETEIDKCTSCLACIEACPVKARIRLPDDFKPKKGSYTTKELEKLGFEIKGTEAVKK